MADGKIVIVKKKVAGHAAHHGGAWKVAYADFVTAMMALFILLWLLSQTDKVTRQKLSEYFRTGLFSGAPSVLTGGSGVQQEAYLDPSTEGTLERAALERTASELKRALAGLARTDDLKRVLGNMKIQVVNDGLLIQIIDASDDLLFDLSSSTLKPALIEVLQTMGPVLGKLKNKIQVHGYTDARPFPAGSKNTNWSLSFDRADNARVVLEGYLRQDQIAGVFAHADTAPIDADPLSAHNRRLAILAVRLGHEDEAAEGKALPRR